MCISRESYIIEKLNEGDMSTFESIYNKYSENVYYVALGYLKNNEEAEDMTQKIFTKLWEKKAKLSVNTSLKGYLHKATVNTCLNYLRHNKLKRKFEEAFIYDNLHETPSNDDITSLIDDVNKAIDKLPEQCRKIFVMSCVMGLKNKEVADELDLSINTVKMHKKIAYKKIRGSVSSEMMSLLILSQFFNNL